MRNRPVSRSVNDVVSMAGVALQDAFRIRDEAIAAMESANDKATRAERALAVAASDLRQETVRRGVLEGQYETLLLAFRHLATKRTVWKRDGEK